jgi:hypothetical protein
MYKSSHFLFYQDSATDELPMRPARGRFGTCFCSVFTPYFTPSKNRDNSSGLLHPDVQASRFRGRTFLLEKS